MQTMLYMLTMTCWPCMHAMLYTCWPCMPWFTCWPCMTCFTSHATMQAMLCMPCFTLSHVTMQTMLCMPCVTSCHWGSSCWSDEDYIGQVSRISRSNHALQLSLRTMQKALGVYKQQLQGLVQKKMCSSIPVCMLMYTFFCIPACMFMQCMYAICKHHEMFNLKLGSLTWNMLRKP